MIDCSDYFSSFEISYIWKWCSENYYRSLIKVKFSTDQVRRALGSGGCSFVVCHHAQKPENGPNSDLFNLTPKYFLPLLPCSDLVPPSTEPVPPSTKQCCPILTQYHNASTSTAFYWPSTTKYQPLPPYTDPVSPLVVHQVQTSIDQYWTSTTLYRPSTTKYQSVLTYTDPVISCIDQYRLLLTHYHQVPTATAFYWPNTITYQPVPLYTDPVPPSVNQYTLYCCCLGITDFCTVYPGSCLTKPQLPNLQQVVANTQQLQHQQVLSWHLHMPGSHQ